MNRNPDGALTPSDCSTSSDRARLENGRRRHLQNPFWVLELSPEADDARVERQGQKLLGMLATELPEAQSYPTPFGRCLRTPELVRAAMAELHDPDCRLLAEWWMHGLGAKS